MRYYESGYGAAFEVKHSPQAILLTKNGIVLFNGEASVEIRFTRTGGIGIILAEAFPTTAVLAPSSAPEKWRFTVQQYDLLYDHGFFANQSVELLWGEIYEKHPNVSEANPLGEPAPVRWTVAEYERMADLGIFEDRRVQLIEGRIYQMPPQRVPHSVALELVNRFLSRAFSSDHRIRIQSPFLATDGSEPEPDFAVISGDDPRAAKEHPSAAVLIIEISDTSIRLDHDKVRVYSIAGVPEYWIVNIPRRVLEVHRDPIPGGGTPEGPAYKSVQTLAAHEIISPLAAPQALVSVAELLP